MNSSTANLMENFKLYHTNELAAMAAKLLNAFPDQKKFVFYGEIGAGKTTFIKEILKLLGVTDNVSSPTYSLVSEYEGTRHLVRHLDLYRLNTIEEALDLNIEEYLDDEQYCFIEWPEIIEPLFPEKIAYIRITINEDNSRDFVFGEICT